MSIGMGRARPGWRAPPVGSASSVPRVFLYGAFLSIGSCRGFRGAFNLPWVTGTGAQWSCGCAQSHRPRSLVWRVVRGTVVQDRCSFPHALLGKVCRIACLPWIVVRHRTPHASCQTPCRTAPQRTMKVQCPRRNLTSTRKSSSRRHSAGFARNQEKSTTETQRHREEKKGNHRDTKKMEPIVFSVTSTPLWQISFFPGEAPCPGAGAVPVT